MFNVVSCETIHGKINKIKASLEKCKNIYFLKKQTKCDTFSAKGWSICENSEIYKRIH